MVAKKSVPPPSNEDASEGDQAGKKKKATRDTRGMSDFGKYFSDDDDGGGAPGEADASEEQDKGKKSGEESADSIPEDKDTESPVVREGEERREW